MEGFIMLFCKKCGRELDEDMKVCPDCGESIEKSKIAEGKTLEEVTEINNNETKSSENPEVSENQRETDNIENFADYTSENFSGVNKGNNAEKFVKKLFLGIVCIVVIGVICISAVNVYNNSPERIFEKVKESESFEKYVTQKKYIVNKYYLADIIGGDDEKELLFEVALEKSEEEGIGIKKIYIAKKDSVSGEYKIGKFSGIGGELIENIEMYMSEGDAEKEFFVCLKNISEVSDSYLDFTKAQYNINDDETAKEYFYAIYGMGLGYEQYGVFKMTDYSFTENGGENAERESCDFSFGLTPEKVFVKGKDSQTDGFVYQCLNFSEINEQTSNDDNTVSEEEFNKYIEEFKAGKKPFESFDVPEYDVEEETETEEETESVE